MKISAHMMVKNEPKWAWYAIKSVIDYVDEFLIWDTGSTDNTTEIIKSIASPKIKFASRLTTTAADVSECRQEMLAESKGDWLFLVDSDEVWTDDALKQSLAELQPDRRFIINRFRNLVGDVYHYQEEAAGQYRVGPYKGHVTIRFYNIKKTKLHYEGVYPLEGFCDANGNLLQKDFQNEPVIAEPYLHMTHLRIPNAHIHNRSNYKYELGLTMPNDFNYPKSFYFPQNIVESAWSKRSVQYLVNAAWQSPLRYIKRRVHI